MEARSLPEALKLIMKQRKCSQTQLSRDLGKVQSWVSEVISGKQATSFAKMIKLLDGVGWEVVIRPKPEVQDPVKRREFVAAAASVMFVPSPKTGPYQDAVYLRGLAKRISRDRYEHGGMTGVSAAMRHIRQITAVTESSDRTLQSAAADLAIEAVWTLNDVGRLDVAEKVGRLALELAQLSHNANAQSRSYSVLARVQYHRGEAGLAVKYAQRGASLSDVSAEQLAWLKLRHGWSLSMVNGQEHEARDVIEDVQRFLADAKSSEPAFPLDIAELTGSVGRTLYDLGAHREARECLDEAVELLGEFSPRLQGIYLARQITASLQASQPTFAADRMLKLARVVPLVNSAQLNKHLKEVVAMSGHWRVVSEVRAARAQLRTVLQGAAANSQ
jgi:transcriptional regulator with XRE-family HTH domain